jgi:hypothetical protein
MGSAVLTLRNGGRLGPPVVARGSSANLVFPATTVMDSRSGSVSHDAIIGCECS